MEGTSMLGKAICEISALNKKAVGVPDSSMFTPRAKFCTPAGQELGLLEIPAGAGSDPSLVYNKAD